MTGRRTRVAGSGPPARTSHQQAAEPVPGMEAGRVPSIRLRILANGVSRDVEVSSASIRGTLERKIAGGNTTKILETRSGAAYTFCRP